MSVFFPLRWNPSPALFHTFAEHTLQQSEACLVIAPQVWCESEPYYVRHECPTFCLAESIFRAPRRCRPSLIRDVGVQRFVGQQIPATV